MKHLSINNAVEHLKEGNCHFFHSFMDSLFQSVGIVKIHLLKLALVKKSSVVPYIPEIISDWKR